MKAFTPSKYGYEHTELVELPRNESRVIHALRKLNNRKKLIVMLSISLGAVSYYVLRCAGYVKPWQYMSFFVRNRLSRRMDIDFVDGSLVGRVDDCGDSVNFGPEGNALTFPYSEEQHNNINISTESTHNSERPQVVTAKSDIFKSALDENEGATRSTGVVYNSKSGNGFNGEDKDGLRERLKDVIKSESEEEVAAANFGQDTGYIRKALAPMVSFLEAGNDSGNLDEDFDILSRSQLFGTTNSISARSLANKYAISQPLLLFRRDESNDAHTRRVLAFELNSLATALYNQLLKNLDYYTAAQLPISVKLLKQEFISLNNAADSKSVLTDEASDMIDLVKLKSRGLSLLNWLIKTAAMEPEQRDPAWVKRYASKMNEVLEFSDNRNTPKEAIYFLRGLFGHFAKISALTGGVDSMLSIRGVLLEKEMFSGRAMTSNELNAYIESMHVVTEKLREVVDDIKRNSFSVYGHKGFINIWIEGRNTKNENHSIVLGLKDAYGCALQICIDALELIDYALNFSKDNLGDIYNTFKPLRNFHRIFFFIESAQKTLNYIVARKKNGFRSIAGLVKTTEFIINKENEAIRAIKIVYDKMKADEADSGNV